MAEQQPLLLQKTASTGGVYDTIISETNAEVEQLANDIKDLHETMGLVNQLVGEQGEQLNKVEDNVNVTQENTIAAVEDIELADEQNTSFRKKVICFAVVAVLLVVVLVIVLLVVFKKI
eukprot:TRINITY_DN19301_c0_g1_i1.p1 TRINITY_DN19301_c0_g1~~TRINITY_DN19301_c0_g1_i1.p1  ORF type:complete len:132 (+),score=37.24 TRINITY_DN19301_c0_g1_i1:41-397(+)